jgi:MSHA biogenesis protein MshE
LFEPTERRHVLLLNESRDTVTIVSDLPNTHERNALIRRAFPGQRAKVFVVNEAQFRHWATHLVGPHVPRDPSGTSSQVRSTSLENIFQKALEPGVSDVYLEKHARHFQIGFRVYGQMTTPEMYPVEYGVVLLARIRTLAHLNPGKFLATQEGHFSYIVNGESVQFRLSEVETDSGSTMVLRVFVENRALIPIDRLGMPTDMLRELKDFLRNPSGLLLLTGPTGSGKTTTLYSILSYLASESKKIMSVEDPVECPLRQIVQVEASAKAGFPVLLKALLRQDPDVVMVGEIRDKETASTAVQAALTGHFVLSTLHAKSPSDVILRLLELNIDRFSINSTLVGVLSQCLSPFPDAKGCIVSFEWCAHNGRRSF